MKALFKILIFLVTLTGLVSCSDLDQNPTDRLSSTIFWKAEADADLALTGLYNTLYAGGDVNQYGPIWWENFSDNSYDIHNLGGSQDSHIAGLSPMSGGFVSGAYTNCYIAIAATNSFLSNVNKVLTGDKLKQYKGEAFFLRGFNYFLLAQLYGNVPLITEDPFGIDYKSKKAKSPRADILKQVSSDLDSAIAYLPNVKYTTGHVVKAAAQGYKVRLLLFEKKYDQAASLANSIIESKLFTLNPNYAGNFIKPDQQSSPEIMFSIQYQAPNSTHPYSLSALLVNSGWCDLQGTQNMIDEYENGDPRKKMTFFFPGDGREQGWPHASTVGTPGVNGWVEGFYLAKKWVDPKILDPLVGVLDDQDFVLLRFADIKLMYAEAQNEVAGADESVYQQVNEVRARPGVDMPALPANLSKDEMRLRIRHERRVELALEGERYFDLRRWGIAKEKLNGFTQGPNLPLTIYKDTYEFWPIPQTEIDRNYPVLIQNDL